MNKSLVICEDLKQKLEIQVRNWNVYIKIVKYGRNSTEFVKAKTHSKFAFVESVKKELNELVHSSSFRLVCLGRLQSVSVVKKTLKSIKLFDFFRRSCYNKNLQLLPERWIFGTLEQWERLRRRNTKLQAFVYRRMFN